MTLDKANELIAMHVDLGSGYNRDAVKMVLGEVDRNFDQTAVDKLIRDHGLEEKRKIKPGTKFTSVFTK